MNKEDFTDPSTAIGAIVDLAITALGPQQAPQPNGGDESIPFVIVPNQHRVEDLEKLLPRPTRARGNTTLRDAKSFIRYVNTQKEEGTRIFGTVEPPKFVAVFNDHLQDGAGWRDHTATYACPLSIEWATWKGKNGVKMSQEAFAQFIEDNSPDCVDPPSADMIEISRSLEAKKAVNFAQSVRLPNGQHELTYEETVTGTAAKGRLSVPEVFSIGIPVLEGGGRYEVNARLRYRIDGGKLSMWFDLERPHKVLEDAVDGVRYQIEEGTSLEIFNGTP